MDMLKDLHEMCGTISKAIVQANDKIRTAGGKISSADVDYIDKLTHTMKSLKSTIAMVEAEENGDDEYSERYSRDGGSYRGSYRNYDGRSYARGRGRNANRDSMGRYSSRDDYSSYDDGLVDDLKDLMQKAPDEKTRQEIMRLVNMMEQR